MKNKARKKARGAKKSARCEGKGRGTKIRLSRLNNKGQYTFVWKTPGKSIFAKLTICKLGTKMMMILTLLAPANIAS